MWQMNSLSLVSIIHGWGSWSLAFDNAPDYDPAQVFNDLLEHYPKAPLVVWLEDWRVSHVLIPNPIAAAIEALLNDELYIDLESEQFTTENDPRHFSAKALINTADYLDEKTRLALPEFDHAVEIPAIMIRHYQVAVLVNDKIDRDTAITQAARYNT